MSGERAKNYTARERREVSGELARGEVPLCPRCLIVLIVRDLEPPPGVPYVRHRLWVMCPLCRAAGTLDRERTNLDGRTPTDEPRRTDPD